VVLEQRREMVLDSGTLVLAAPSSRLDSGPLRSAVVERTRLKSSERRTDIPCGAFVFRIAETGIAE
jgi:hypothetical protein